MTIPESTFGRQWQLIQLLSESPDGLSVNDIVSLLSCSKRTVQRNLSAFREYGIPLIEETGQHGLKTYRIAFHCAIPTFSFDEIVAVYISRRFLEPMMGTYLWQAMQNALDKMRGCLGTQMIRHLEKSIGVIEHTAFGRGDYQKFAPIIDDLNFAIEENRQVSILYKSVKELKPSTTKVDPYGLAYNSGSLYLIGYSHKRKEIRHWKIDRTNSITVSNNTFSADKSFDFSKYVKQLFGIFKGNKKSQLVRIRFQSFVADEIKEKHWHETERFTEQPDGSVILEMKIDELAALKRWILGFGRHAEVLEPLELRVMILKEIQLTEAYYR